MFISCSAYNIHTKKCAPLGVKFIKRGSRGCPCQGRDEGCCAKQSYRKARWAKLVSAFQECSQTEQETEQATPKRPAKKAKNSTEVDVGTENKSARNLQMKRSRRSKTYHLQPCLQIKSSKNGYVNWICTTTL